MWHDFWYWMTEREGWKIIASLVYFAICLFDFIIYPTWIEMHRPNVADVVANLPVNAGETVQLQYMQVLTTAHDPLTLKGGGLFHLAMGALLTGAAVVRHPGLSGNGAGGAGTMPDYPGGRDRRRGPNSPLPSPRPAPPGPGAGKAQDDEEDS